MKLDLSLAGVIKTSPYLIMTGIYWLESQGINIQWITGFFILTSIDIVTGIWKSIVVKSLPNPTSKVGIRRVTTKFAMLLFPVVIATIYSFFAEDYVRMLNWGVMILALHEGYSALANLYTIRTGEVVEEFDVITYVLKKMLKKVRLVIEKITNIDN